MAGSFFGNQASKKFRQRASQQLAKAKQEQRQQAMVRSLVRRRQFLANFRLAQGEALAGAGQAAQGGLSLDSSAVRGTQASIGTQRNVAVADDLFIRESNAKINLLNDRAQLNLEKAESNQAIGDEFTSMVKTAATFGMG
jgi:hypothetical protein